MSLRDLERASIREFVLAHADKFPRGRRVLDLGCGDQPYRSLIEAQGAIYNGWDRVANPGSVVTEDVGRFGFPLQAGPWSAILCTQVVQYLLPEEDWDSYMQEGNGMFLDPLVLLAQECHYGLRKGGWLVLTGPTNWPVVEDADLTRYTPKGVEVRLALAGFSEIEVTRRAEVVFGEGRWSVGWGAVARA